MKLFVIAVILSVLSVAVQSVPAKEEDMTLFNSVVGACKEETGASVADVETFARYESLESMEGKCLRACSIKKIGVMNADGKFVKEVAMKFIEKKANGDAAKLKLCEEPIDACKDIAVSDNNCEAAEQYWKCLIDEAAKRGLNVEDFTF